MKLADHEPEATFPREGWTLYDGRCGFCLRWVHLWQKVVERRGFAVRDLQSASADRLLQIPEENLLDDVQVLTRSGTLESGANAYLYVSRKIWWAWPFYAIFHFSGFNSICQASIRFFGGATAGSIEIDIDSLATVDYHSKPATGTRKR